MEREQQDIDQILHHIRQRVIQQIQNRIINVEYNFMKLDYSSNAMILDTILPGPEVVSLARYYLDIYILGNLIMIILYRSLQAILHKSNTVLIGHELIQDLLLEIFKNMDETSIPLSLSLIIDGCWVTPKGPRKFGVREREREISFLVWWSSSLYFRYELSISSI